MSLISQGAQADVRAARAAVLERFVAADASAPQHALTISSGSLSADERSFFDDFVACRIIIEIGGRYYVDKVALAQTTRGSTMRLRFAVIVVLGMVAAMIWYSMSLHAETPTQWVDSSPHHVRQIVVQPGVHLEILDWGGRGQPLVFLAGYGNSAHIFDGFAPALRDQFHVIGITRRGFGASSLAPGGYNNETLVRDVLTVLDSMHLVRPILVAHSFGGSELNTIGVLHPEVARALIYLDSGFDFAELYADSAWVHTPIPRPPVATDNDGSPRATVAYLTEMLGPGYPESEARSASAWSADVQNTPAFHADSLAAWLMRGTPPARLHDMRLPVLAIYGVPQSVERKYPWYSRLAPKERLEAEQRFALESRIMAHQRSRFRNEVPNARVVEIADGRHYVFLTHPADVARAIREFGR